MRFEGGFCRFPLAICNRPIYCVAQLSLVWYSAGDRRTASALWLQRSFTGVKQGFLMQEKWKDPGSSQGEETGQSQFETLARNMVRLFDQGAKAASTLAERSGANGNGSYSMSAEMTEAAKSLGEVARHWVTDPSKLVAA